MTQHMVREFDRVAFAGKKSSQTTCVHCHNPATHRVEYALYRVGDLTCSSHGNRLVGQLGALRAKLVRR